MLVLPTNTSVVISLMSQKRHKLDEQITSVTPRVLVEYLDFSVATVDLCQMLVAEHFDSIHKQIARSIERISVRTEAMQRTTHTLEEAIAALSSGAIQSEADRRANTLNIQSANLLALGTRVAEQNEELFNTYVNGIGQRHYEALEQVLRVDDPELLKRIAGAIAEMSAPWALAAAVGGAVGLVWGPIAGTAAATGTKTAIELTINARQLREAARRKDPEAGAAEAGEFIRALEAFDVAALNWCVGTYLQTKALEESQPVEDAQSRTVDEVQKDASEAVLSRHASILRSRLRV